MRFLYDPGVFELLPAVIAGAILRLDSEDDRQFMASLYLTYSGQLLAYALRLSGNRADAEDAVQDAFLSLIQKASLLREMEQTRLKGYVFISVRNAAYLLKRKEQRHRQLETAVPTGQEGAADQEKELSLYPYTADALRKAILQLSERDRTLLQMKYFQRRSDAEIAALFHVRTDSVRVLTGRARARLSKLLREGGLTDD